MQIRLLGSLEILGGNGEVIELDGARPRGLLSLLAVRANQTVSAAQLADELWQERLPKSAATALRVHINSLRKALEPERPRASQSVLLPSDPGGYRLAVGDEQLDTLRFETLLAQARDTASGGALAEAVELYETAAALWRGPAFADARELGPIAYEAVRLEELHGAGIEELAHALLRLGEASRATEILTDAIVRHPLRENLTAHLMVALYRAGRQSDALRAFSDLAARLDRELGITPTNELRAIEESVLLQDPALDWVAPASSPVAEPHPRDRRRFIGRRSELAALDQLLDDSDRAPTAAIVTGPAGIGKTTTVQRFCERARARGARTAVGRCDADAQAPYQPFAEILAALSAVLAPVTETALAEDLARVAPELFGTAPTNRDGSGSLHLDPVERSRVFEAVAETLASAATEPLVIVVDDAQWMDHASFALVRYLLRHPALASLRIVLTWRDDELAPNADLHLMLARLREQPTAVTVDLGGFDRDEVEAFLRSLAPSQQLHTVISFSDAVQRVTRGNPLFVRELIRDIAESTESNEGIRSRIEESAPLGMRPVVHRRIQRVSPRTQRLLQVGAVAGNSLELDVLVRATGMTEIHTLDALDEALDAQLLTPPQAPLAIVSFSHAIIRNTIYHQLEPAIRSEFHGDVATAMVACRSGGPEDRWAAIAHHYLLAPRGQYGARAMEAAQFAADGAMRQFAFESAVEWYRRVLELHPEFANSRSNAPEWYRLGRALDAAGRPDEAKDALEHAAASARADGDAELFGDVVLASIGETTIPFFTQSQSALVDEALTLIGDRDAERRVLLLSAKAATRFFTTDRQDVVVAEAAITAARGLTGHARAAATTAWHRALLHDAERLDERLTVAREAYTSSSESPETFRLQRQRDLLVCLLQAGYLQEFSEALADYETQARTTRNPLARYNAMALRATEACFGSDLSRAEQLANGALTLGERFGVPDPRGGHLLHLFVIRLQQGRLTELPPGKQRAAAPTRTTPAGFALAATAVVETGHPELAAPILDDLLDDEGAGLPRDSFWLAAMALLSSAAVATKQRDRIDQIRAAIEPCHEQVVVFGAGGAVLGVVGQWLGLLALGNDDLDAAKTLLTSAAAQAEVLGMPYWEAQARIDLAAALHRRGSEPEVAEAARIARECAAAAAQFGFAGLTRRISSYGLPGI